VEPTNETAHAFIVRIWMETRELKDAEPIWRGVIEDVHDSKRVYCMNLDQVVAYLVSIIEAMGGRISKK